MVYLQEVAHNVNVYTIVIPLNAVEFVMAHTRS